MDLTQNSTQDTQPTKTSGGVAQIPLIEKIVQLLTVVTAEVCGTTRWVNKNVLMVDF